MNVATGADISKMQAGLKSADLKIRAAALKALDQFGAVLVGHAADRAPVATGFLKASGTEEPAEVKGQHITKVLGFNADYAAAVEENLEAHHDQGEAKYLEKTMREDAPKMAPFVADAVRAAGG